MCLLAEADMRRVLGNKKLLSHCEHPCVLGKGSHALECPTGDGDDEATATCLGECACVFFAYVITRGRARDGSPAAQSLASRVLSMRREDLLPTPIQVGMRARRPLFACDKANCTGAR